jgi:hypothetical protein
LKNAMFMLGRNTLFKTPSLHIGEIILGNVNRTNFVAPYMVNLIAYNNPNPIDRSPSR